MKLKSSILIAVAALLAHLPLSASVWQQMEGNQAPVKTVRTTMPEQYRLYVAAESSLKNMLTGVSGDPDQATIIALPMPDGSLMDFKVWKNELLAPGLGARYSDIQTFTAAAVKDSRITGKIDYTLKGFHAMIFNGANTIFIDPYTNVPSDYYLVYDRKDDTRPVGELMSCHLDDHDEMADAVRENPAGTALKTQNGSSLRKYRLALACTGEYAAAVGGSTPTKATVLSAMVTTMNRVNGVYERELAVTMQLISNTDDLIYLSGATDPYSNLAGDSMLTQNQATVTTVIGSANYDIGHVFSTGGGGIASLGSLCRTNSKARGVTGSPSPVGDAYDIDFVAHEMGHQFGSNHTFNNNIHGSCLQNAEQTLAYEPASGSTIMAYAGICSPDNVQAHSDAYFHAASLAKIMTNITSSTISACPTITTSGNKPVGLPAFSQSYYIPYKTPFELTAPVAIDSVTNPQNTYCWEQWNLGDFGARFSNTFLRGPITRSFAPDTSRTRVFPAIAKLLTNVTSYTGEKLPDTARYLTYKLTVRSFFNAVGSIYFPDDTIHLDVINTGSPFLVTSPNIAGLTWTGGSTQAITWNVSNTTAAPINCAAVDIYLSVDGGKTYPYTLATGIANSGSATVTIPNLTTTTARVKVKGAGNVFFDICNYNLSITPGTTAVSGVAQQDALKVYPVPATSELHISTGTTDSYHLMLTDQTGRTVWENMISGDAVIPVNTLARGIYYLKANNATSGVQLTKKVVLR